MIGMHFFNDIIGEYDDHWRSGGFYKAKESQMQFFNGSFLSNYFEVWCCEARLNGNV